MKDISNIDVGAVGISEPVIHCHKRVGETEVTLKLPVKILYLYRNSTLMALSVNIWGVATQAYSVPDLNSWLDTDQIELLTLLKGLERILIGSLVSFIDANVNDPDTKDYCQLFKPAPIEYWKSFIRIQSIRQNRQILEHFHLISSSDPTQYQFYQLNPEFIIDDSYSVETDGIFAHKDSLNCWYRGQEYAE